jgi:hypothetical protein
VSAKLFYALLSQLSQAERRGAVLALSTLLPAVEESYLRSFDKGEPSLDFFALCADVVAGVALALQMAADDGLVPRDLPMVPKSGLSKTMDEAEAALQRIMALVGKMTTAPVCSNKQ